MTSFRSRLYACTVRHARMTPVPHAFTYRYTVPCLDLDEIATLASQSVFFGTDGGKPLRFLPKDFLLGRSSEDPVAFKREIIAFANQSGVEAEIARVEVLAHLRALGYWYNPAAFFFCYDASGVLACAIVEVTNTFREKKLYLVRTYSADRLELYSVQRKDFYVSPFVDLDTDFEFKMEPPREHLNIQIASFSDVGLNPGADSVEPSRRQLAVRSVLTGDSRPLTRRSLAALFFSHLLIGPRVMIAIHYQAVRLYFKRIPYFKKSDRAHLQKGVSP